MREENPASQIKVAVLEANQARTSSVVLTDITGLTVPVVAGGWYEWEAQLIVTEAGTAAGLLVAIDIPTTPTTFTGSGLLINNGTNAIADAVTFTAEGTVIDNALATAATHILWLRGTLINGTTAGNFKLQFAQKVSDAGAVTMVKGSYLKVARLYSAQTVF